MICINDSLTSVGTLTGRVVFGSTAEGGYYLSSMIPASINSKTITITRVNMPPTGTNIVANCYVDKRTKLGFSIMSTNSGVAGNACYVEFTVA